MAAGYPRLLGDVGGTNARWVWRATGDAPIEQVITRACADHPAAYAAVRDARSLNAVRRFTGWMGSMAGNLALNLGARDGVSQGGGILPRLGPAFDETLLHQRFEAKGRLATYMQAIPTWLISAAQPALAGADRALDEAI